MRRFTIRVDEKLAKALARLAKRSGQTKSQIARDALRRHVTVKHFRVVRSKILPFAEAQGLLTDEDIFRAVS
jgi:predicted transcriptional regulator